MSDADRIAALESALTMLQRRMSAMEDVHAIRKLHHLYGYFIDK